MIALEGRFAYSFVLGMAGAVNPCGFVMLPAYLMYFLGLEGSKPGSQRASLQRALVVSLATSAGFVSVFVVVGTISRLFTSVIEQNAKYGGFAIGIALIVLGCFMLAGWKPPFALPQITSETERRKTFTSMFGFGVAYAVASIGCLIGLVVSSIFSTFGSAGFVSGVVVIALYGVGMALLVSALTITLAFASGGLLRVLRSALRFMDRAAAVFIMCTGFYLTWYWYSSITERSSDGLTSRVESWSSRLNDFLSRQGVWSLAIVLGAVVAAGIVYVVLSRGRKPPMEPGRAGS
jgi:cytochrome c-type biogenesis protein